MRKAFLICLLWMNGAAAQVLIPAGAELHVRLKTAVSSNTSKPEQIVEAVTILPVLSGAHVILPAGLTARGRVTETKPSMKTNERASLGLQFDEFGGAKSKAIVVDVDNARESVDQAGQILGILASETLAARADQGIGKVAQKNAGLAGILEAAKGAVLTGAPSGEIKYDPGVELRIRLVAPLLVTDIPKDVPLGPVSNEKELISIVQSEPFQTVAESPPKPSDITNLMFIGSEEQLRAAFQAAGWTLAHEKNTQSVLETVRAIAELRGYKEAPMSRLLLEGKRSDFDFQKQNNTFAKRHHLRIW